MCWGGPKYMHIYTPRMCPKRPEKCSKSFETKITGGCELADVGAGNQIEVLCKSSKYTAVPNHLPTLYSSVLFF